VIERFGVGGMTCGSCVRHVKAALGAVPGVRSAEIDLASATATVVRDPAVASAQQLHEAVQAAGYTLDEPAADAPAWPFRRPIVFGVLATLGLVGFYLGTITLAQGWAHALQQLLDDRWFVGAIVLGFGTQMGLFTHLRGLHARASVGGVAASTGTSATAMLACCAHHLTEILPILGLSGAAVFLNAYKTPLLWLGIALNLGGIAYLSWQLRSQRRMACQASVLDVSTR
jgi:copper chaperone CopZ